MRTNLILAAAVAATFAAGAASAATVDIYVSGSSALQSFFQKDLQASICGGGTAIANLSYKDTTLASSAGQPGFTYYSCANGTTTYALHYASDLGSTWGVAGALNPTLQRDQIVTACATGTATCNDTGHFDRINDTSTALNASGVMGQHASDILTFDVEPTLFTSDNWPTANSDTTLIPNKLSTTPTAAQLAGISTSVMNGQIFSIIVNNAVPGVGISGGNAAGTQFTNLSTNSIRAILTGQYNTWNEVPEVSGSDATGLPIVLCRRDHGSGSEISASLTFSGVECGAASSPIAATNNAGNLNTVLEEPTSADVKTCVNANAGGIGLVGLGLAATYTTVAIDGYAPNAHNAAAGHYNFAYEDHAQNNTAHSGASSATQTVVATLLADAAAQAKLVNYYHETAALGTGGVAGYTTAAPAGYYAVQGVGGNAVANTAGGAFTAATQPVSLFNRNGNSCQAKINSN